MHASPKNNEIEFDYFLTNCYSFADEKRGYEKNGQNGLNGHNGLNWNEMSKMLF